MIVVSDTTPLIALMKVSRLDVVQKLFSEILIPMAVLKELTSNYAFQSEAEQILHCSFIRAVEVNEPKAVDILRRSTGLDLGESEAIIYADDHHADVLLMDERKGRQVAKSMGLRVMGTIGIILEAYEEKILTAQEAKETLMLLKENGQRISESLVHYAISRIQQT